VTNDYLFSIVPFVGSNIVHSFYYTDHGLGSINRWEFWCWCPRKW